MAANRYWDKFSKESIITLFSPFIVSLGSGNLKLDTFAHFVAQDVQFLKCFAQAYELAEDCADDDDARVCIVKLRKRVLKELKSHGSFVQEWDLDLSKETTPNPATTKYTNFVLATASGKVEGVKGPGELATPFEKTKVAAYTLSAMAPFFRLNVFIAKELMNFNGDQHPYKKWIDKYSSETYQEVMLETEDVLDKLSVSLTGEELDIMQKLYHQALKLEMAFFLAQPVDQQTLLPLSKQHNPVDHRLRIFSDFDLTCSVVDSSAILAEIAIVTAPKLDQSQSQPPESQSQNQIARMSSADLRNTWEVLSREYTEEYEQCTQKVVGSQKVDGFDYGGLKKALEEISDFEKRANTRVIESNVLKGLNVEDIKRAGERLILHDGCMGFFQSVTNGRSLNADVHVVSYCWCADLIRSSFSSGGIHAMHIHANEFEYENSLSTGGIIKKIETPVDKLEYFTEILENSDQTDKTNLTIYIGDSVGDLLCLLEADIGIVIGSSPSLVKIATHFGASFVPLFPALIKRQKEHVEGSEFSWKRLSGVLYTVTSWAEIHSFVIGF